MDISWIEDKLPEKQTEMLNKQKQRLTLREETFMGRNFRKLEKALMFGIYFRENRPKNMKCHSEKLSRYAKIP